VTAPVGLAPFGPSQWGSGIVPVSMVTAYAISTRQVYVLFSGALQARSGVLKGDALNPGTWKVVRLDTNAVVPMVGVRLRSPSEVVVTCLDPLPPFTDFATISAPELKDAAGTLISLPRDMTFAGLTEAAISTPEKIVQGATVQHRDLLNYAAINLGVQGGGTLVVAGGDYVNQSGVDLIRKLVLRRILTTPGDFFWLPEYGVGLRVKEPIPAGDVVKLRAAIERQVSLEPEVTNVKASVTQSANLLTVIVSVVVRTTGQSLTVTASAKVGL